jgi:hypothetical protein
MRCAGNTIEHHSVKRYAVAEQGAQPRSAGRHHLITSPFALLQGIQSLTSHTAPLACTHTLLLVGPPAVRAVNGNAALSTTSRRNESRCLKGAQGAQPNQPTTATTSTATNATHVEVYSFDAKRGLIQLDNSSGPASRLTAVALSTAVGKSGRSLTRRARCELLAPMSAARV